MSRIIFAGTPRFAIPTLSRLVHAGYDIAAVYTQPDRPAGRGLKPRPSDVKQFALAHELNIEQPEDFKKASTVARFKSYLSEILVVAAYGLILPPEIIDLPERGCVNVHASLLPRWRGAAPIVRAILEGDRQTGVSIMRMNYGLDTGPVYSQMQTMIDPSDTAETLEERLSDLGASLLINTLPKILRGLIDPTPQKNQDATYAKKIEKEEASIHWDQTAESIDRHIRAFKPRPVAHTLLHGHILKIHSASVSDRESISLPGTIDHLDRSGIVVATGKGSLCIHQLQLSGGYLKTAEEYLAIKKNGLQKGDRFSALPGETGFREDAFR